MKWEIEGKSPVERTDATVMLARREVYYERAGKRISSGRRCVCVCVYVCVRATLMPGVRSRRGNRCTDAETAIFTWATADWMNHRDIETFGRRPLGNNEGS